VIKNAVQFAEEPDLHPVVLGSSFSRVELASPNYQGRKSEVCLLGIEKWLELQAPCARARTRTQGREGKRATDSGLKKQHGSGRE